MTDMNWKKLKKYPIVRYAIVAAVLLLAVAVTGRAVLRHQRLPIEEPVFVCIPTGSDIDAVVDSLKVHDCIVSEGVFRKVARVRRYTHHVKAGCYKLRPKMGVVQVVNKLYRGNQDAVKVTINKYRTRRDLAVFLGSKLELSADSLLRALNSEEVTAEYGYTPQTILAMFIPNTYEIYWNTSVTKLMDRMRHESSAFWNDRRLSKLDRLGLTQVEVITLASIVDEETNKNDEKAKVASVYLNRLKKGMLLQADPTVKYAVGDFSLRRILNKHTQVDSPYNTYRYRGLPPGPICIPSVASIDAVLANKKTNYLYFCAKEDFSGYHNFAATLEEHQRNAQKFHEALNKRNIR